MTNNHHTQFVQVESPYKVFGRWKPVGSDGPDNEYPCKGSRFELIEHCCEIRGRKTKSSHVGFIASIMHSMGLCEQLKRKLPESFTNSYPGCRTIKFRALLRPASRWGHENSRLAGWFASIQLSLRGAKQPYVPGWPCCG